MEFEFLEFWWEFCVIFRHFFVGSLELRKILWVKVTMKSTRFWFLTPTVCACFFTSRAAAESSCTVGSFDADFRNWPWYLLSFNLLHG